MKFSRKRILANLIQGKQYIGTIKDIEHIKREKREYYNLSIELDEGLTSIWVNDNVTPDHPLFEIFDELIENDEDAEDFDVAEIIGIKIQFTVKNLLIKRKDTDDTERSFFDKVTPLWEEDDEEYDDDE